MSVAAAWGAFSALLVVIVFSGSHLSRYGNQIADRTGLGGTWVGLVLVAAVTSLPELFTGLSAVLIVRAPNLAVGNALGSCVYNLLIVVVLDLLTRREESIYTRAHQGLILSAGWCIVLLGLTAAGIVLHDDLGPLTVGTVGPYAILAPALYLLAMRSVFRYQQRERKEYVEEAVAEGGLRLPLRRLYVLYAAHAFVILLAGVALPTVGGALAETMGWDNTFVGTILLALATSLPEVVISVEAIRLGAVDLAFGNILGSNLFDLLVLGINDLAWTSGPILAAASPDHLVTTIVAIVMTGTFVVALTSRPRTKLFRVLGWTSVALLALGAVNALVLFLLLG